MPPRPAARSGDLVVDLRCRGLRNRIPLGPIGQGRLQAGEGLVESPVASECPGEPGEIAAWRSPARRWIRVVGVDPAEEPGQRPHVLAVVANDVDEWLRRRPAQEVQEAAGDLPAVDVAVAMRPEQLGLDGSEARVGHPVAEDAPDKRQ